jgi:Ca2+/Na+ antiporter
MRKVNLFDLVFIRSIAFYVKHGEKPSFFNGVIILGLCQCCNLSTIIELIPFHDIKFLNKTTAALLCIAFFILNILIYKNQKKRERIQDFWNEKDENKKKTLDIIIFIYVLCSILLFIGLNLYSGIKFHPHSM